MIRLEDSLLGRGLQPERVLLLGFWGCNFPCLICWKAWIAVSFLCLIFRRSIACLWARGCPVREWHYVISGVCFLIEGLPFPFGDFELFWSSHLSSGLRKATLLRRWAHGLWSRWYCVLCYLFLLSTQSSRSAVCCMAVHNGQFACRRHHLVWRGYWMDWDCFRCQWPRVEFVWCFWPAFRFYMLRRNSKNRVE